MGDDFEVFGTNPNAAFKLKVSRGDGMALLGMDWLDPTPPANFVGFAVECRQPNQADFHPLPNRITFATPPSNIGHEDPGSSLWAPIQKFRWVHFPFEPELPGEYRYRVRPAFMDAARAITLGDPHEVGVELRRETYPGKLNVAFTRGFVSSQAFVDRYDEAPITTLIPDVADQGLGFVPTHPKAAEAYPWMGFEARSAILQVLDEAIADPTAEVRVVAYDLNEPGIVGKLEQLGSRLRIVIDNSDAHGKAASAETQAATRLSTSAGATHVKRHHMSNLQHNKTIVVEGAGGNVVVCGSTNFTWRGLYVQANNAIVLRGEKAARVFHEAFSSYWANDSVVGFGTTDSTRWRDLGLAGIDARVSFSPHAAANARLASVAADIESATSSVFYSLAFINQTNGAVRDAVTHVTENPNLFVYGMADRRIGGINLQSPDGNVQPVEPAALTGNLPEPFKSEPTGLTTNGSGTRMHHKFVVLDFDKPTARVYTGSYNVSPPADLKNGENLLRIRDRRIAVSYMVEALRLFDHYRFRVVQAAAPATAPFTLKEPPAPGKTAWWNAAYTVPIKIRDRKLFS